MTNTPAYRKGDLVTYIADWDRKGTVYYRDAIVYSCGRKQMVLTDAETGEEMGRHFTPARAEAGAAGTHPRMTTAEAEACAIALAETILANQRAHFARCLAGNFGAAYDDAIRKNLAALHEPRAASYAALSAAIAARHAK